jgi:hypothetical protein
MEFMGAATATAPEESVKKLPNVLCLLGKRSRKTSGKFLDSRPLMNSTVSFESMLLK